MVENLSLILEKLPWQAVLALLAPVVVAIVKGLLSIRKMQGDESLASFRNVEGWSQNLAEQIETQRRFYQEVIDKLQARYDEQTRQLHSVIQERASLLSHRDWCRLMHTQLPALPSPEPEPEEEEESPPSQEGDH